MRAGEANPTDTFHRPNGGEQIGEEGAQRHIAGALAPQCHLEVAAVTVHVLAQQGDLTHPLSSQLNHLGYHLVERAADFDPAYSRNDAEGTRVVATDLDGDPGVVGGFAPRGQCGGEQRVIIDDCFVEDLGDRPVLAGMAQQLTGSMHIVRTEHHIGPRCSLAHDIAIFLRQAPSDDDLPVGTAFFPRLEVAEVAVQLVIGILTDAAGVEHHYIGFMLIVGRDQAIGLEEAGNALRIVFVHLTPVGANDVAAGHN